MVRPPLRRAARRSAAALVIALVAGAGCSTQHSPAASGPPAAQPAPRTARFAAVRATREPLPENRTSAVVHDTETMALVAHSGRLFAATDQWMYPDPHAAGQILMKRAANAPWTVFEQTQSLRVQALDSFAIPADQELGPHHALLVTQAIVDGRSEVQWLRDGASSFPRDAAFPLASTQADVRAFGAHEDGGVWSVYAGVSPTGILRGTWSSALRTLHFDPTPELTAAPPGAPGRKTQKVTGFADCGGALYVSINTKLFRRNDGELPPATPRWSLVYEAPPVGSFNSGLRGLTCVTHRGEPALLVSTEGSGTVYRFDHLPTGVRVDNALPLVPTLVFSPIPAIRQMLVTQGVSLPASGTGSIGYVIAAYNDFTTFGGGAKEPAFGFEWGYAGDCPSARSCGPTAFGTVTFDAAACFAVLTDHGAASTADLHCLSGGDFATAPAGNPIRNGQAFVSIRTIAPSPFGDDQVYFGGYDCNFFPADGTAWIARAPRRALHVEDPLRKERS